MGTTYQQDLLGLADYAFRRLRHRVEGLSDAEYLWEPVDACWSIRPGADGRWVVEYAEDPANPPDPEPLTTIAWRLCHIIALLIEERNATWIGVPVSGSLEQDGQPSTAAEAIRQLEQAYELFRGQVAAADASSYRWAWLPVGTRTTAAERSSSTSWTSSSITGLRWERCAISFARCIEPDATTADQANAASSGSSRRHGGSAPGREQVMAAVAPASRPSHSSSS